MEGGEDRQDGKDKEPSKEDETSGQEGGKSEEDTRGEGNKSRASTAREEDGQQGQSQPQDVDSPREQDSKPPSRQDDAATDEAKNDEDGQGREPDTDNHAEGEETAAGHDSATGNQPAAENEDEIQNETDTQPAEHVTADDPADDDRPQSTTHDAAHKSPSCGPSRASTQSRVNTPRSPSVIQTSYHRPYSEMSNFEFFNQMQDGKLRLIQETREWREVYRAPIRELEIRDIIDGRPNFRNLGLKPEERDEAKTAIQENTKDWGRKTMEELVNMVFDDVEKMKTDFEKHAREKDDSGKRHEKTTEDRHVSEKTENGQKTATGDKTEAQEASGDGSRPQTAAEDKSTPRKHEDKDDMKPDSDDQAKGEHGYENQTPEQTSSEQ